MTEAKRVFIFGAGFSKPAGMPLATELLKLILEQLPFDKDDDLYEWLNGLQKRLDWLSEYVGKRNSFDMNIEQVFHLAPFDIEVCRLKQQLSSVGRIDGPCTPWAYGESIESWLNNLEDSLRDVIFQRDTDAKLACIDQWATTVTEHDTVLTFNYDTLVERALEESNKSWVHGFECEENNGIPIYKLHGSIDWIVAHRKEKFSKLKLLFDKPNVNGSHGTVGHVEEESRLWRCTTHEQLSNWIHDRNFSFGSNDSGPRTVGIAGLGAYKELHRIPGLGPVWAHGMQSLYKAELAVIVGFSMSDFDTMAQMQFAAIARARDEMNRPLRAIVIDPFMDNDFQQRFSRVFRHVEFVKTKHEDFDWSSLEQFQHNA